MPAPVVIFHTFTILLNRAEAEVNLSREKATGITDAPWLSGVRV